MRYSKELERALPDGWSVASIIRYADEDGKRDIVKCKRYDGTVGIVKCSDVDARFYSHEMRTWQDIAPCSTHIIQPPPGVRLAEAAGALGSDGFWMLTEFLPWIGDDSYRSMPREDGERMLDHIQSALKGMNDAGYIHRDIHIGNIGRRYDGTFVLFDFDTAVKSLAYKSGFDGCLRYIPRAIHKSEVYSPSTDLESLVITAIDLDKDLRDISEGYSYFEAPDWDESDFTAFSERVTTYAEVQGVDQTEAYIAVTRKNGDELREKRIKALNKLFRKAIERWPRLGTLLSSIP